MTPKEALFLIRYGTTYTNDEYDNAIEVLTNLVAKATPMKPIVEIDEEVKWKAYSKLDYTDYRCPRCRKYIGYCHYFCPEKDCGQAIDWSDEK